MTNPLNGISRIAVALDLGGSERVGIEPSTASPHDRKPMAGVVLRRRWVG
jgi:hypothetical protein